MKEKAGVGAKVSRRGKFFVLQHTFFTPKVLIEEVIKNLNLLLTQLQNCRFHAHIYVMYANILHIHAATQEWHNFLDALASLDFKLSLSQ